MRRKSKIDSAALTVLLLVLSIIIIVIVATVLNNNKEETKTTEPPELTFPNIPSVPERDDIKVNHTTVSSEDCYKKDGIEFVYSMISYPYIEGGNAEATAKINASILNFASERVTIKSFEKTNAEEAYERANREGMSFIEFEFITRAESVYVKNGYLSIMFRRIRTVGINEPSEDITTMCFDLISGEEVDISNFMNIDRDSATGFLIDIFTQHIKINPGLYYNDALQTLPDIIDLKSFYLTENGLVLYFNPDIITPSVTGIRDFTVQYDKVGH